MMLEKQRLSFDDIDQQMAFELPERETMLVTVVITNVLNNLTIAIDVRNNNVAVQVCAIVEALNTAIFLVPTLDCEIRQ